MQEKQINTKKSFLAQHWLLVVAIIYLLLPVDLVPDTIPVLGLLDDAGLLLVQLLQEYNRWRRDGVVNKYSTPEVEVKDGEIVE